VYIALHKPLGVVTTAHDEQGRVTVLDLIKSDVRIFPVGRLDRDSEGLLLLTNDGELAARLTHPRFGLEKEYFVRVPQPLAPDLVRSLARGIELDGQITSPARIDVAAPPLVAGSKHGDHWIRVVIHEGRNRQIRRMLAHVGVPTLRLVRTRIGPLPIGRLKGGESRRLAPGEVERLRLAAGLGTSAQTPIGIGEQPVQRRPATATHNRDGRMAKVPAKRRR
jgi:23S rRNA pseudouridine2605 synthase